MPAKKTGIVMHVTAASLRMCDILQLFVPETRGALKE